MELVGKIKIGALLSALCAASAFGGSMMQAKMRQAEAQDALAVQGGRIASLEQTHQEDHDRLIRVETLLEDTSKTVDRIEKRLDR